MYKLLTKCSTERLLHWMDVIDTIIETRRSKKVKGK
jgi:hypothetical protein